MDREDKPCLIAHATPEARQRQTEDIHMKIALNLQDRKRLSLAADSLKMPATPAVFIAAPKQKALPKTETREAAELRREKVEAITRRPPEVIITSRWVYTASQFDAQSAVILKLPMIQRLRNWLRSDLA